MAQITVTPQKLREAAEEMRQLNTRFKGQVEDLGSKESSLNTQWEGPAKEKFHLAFLSDKKQMDNFAQTIDDYVNKLEMIAGQYEQAEAKNENTASTRTY